MKKATNYTLPDHNLEPPEDKPECDCDNGFEYDEDGKRPCFECKARASKIRQLLNKRK